MKSFVTVSSTVVMFIFTAMEVQRETMSAASVLVRQSAMQLSRSWMVVAMTEPSIPTMRRAKRVEGFISCCLGGSKRLV